MKTTYVFGAGASAGSDFQLPCMKGFFSKCISRKKYKNLTRFIEMYFNGESLDNLNLEDVITTLDLGCDQFGKLDNGIDPFFYSAKDDFLNYIIERLDYPAKTSGHKYCDKHVEILRQLNDDDSVITLNYDLVVEWSLRQAQKKLPDENDRMLERLDSILASATHYYGGPSPVLPRETTKMGYLLKLHGSINWFYCPRSGCPHNHAFYSSYYSGTINDVPAHQLCQACGEKLERVIVPPTMGKVFNRFPKMGFIWSLAHREISLSNRVVIIGASLAASDYYFRWLLRSAFQKAGIRENVNNVYVVNNSKEDIRKLSPLLGGREVPSDNCFESLESFIQRLEEFHSVRL